jgi:hypothetical protein
VRKILYVIGILSAPPLRRVMLPERRTGAALGDMQMRADMLDTGATTPTLGRDQLIERQIGDRLAKPAA